ncbi:hypothetical protein NQ314_015641 [Rhamnusium bicolor]|uniref:DUF4794 domain-containing protein n=1 Tax=Rhamnusium bicolor TaxID=1586634 RepID=A0AAV8WYZ6_9CUCU|nr:hypothetical protein NQ314_015641 [Rhamnusium bicolor]
MYKLLSLLLLVLVTAFAEPQSRFLNQFQRAEPAPYQYSGWRPSSPEFNIPQPIYGPPPQEYGPPEELTTTVEPDVTTTEEPTTTEGFSEYEDVNSYVNEPQNQKLTQDEEKGVYYVYHPSGLLQRVIYVTKDDTQNMVYSARLKYENVQPITAPIYTYDSKTLELKRIN